MTTEGPQSKQVKAHNEATWDQMARKQLRFTQPARREELMNPLKTLDTSGWLNPGVQGKRLLCLAAGGGRHGPLYAAAGADVTVVDISAEQLQQDRQMATSHQLSLRTVQTSMDELQMFDEGEFDVVVHPVSTCYLPNLQGVYRQVARVTRPQGLYISQHKQPTSLQADVKPSAGGFRIGEPYYRSGPLAPSEPSLHREAGAMEFLHRWEELLGLMCRAGFVIEDLIEPQHADPAATHGSFSHRSCFVAPYVRVKARRVFRPKRSIIVGVS